MSGLAYSVIIPVFNEEEGLGELYTRLTRTMENLKKPYEIIFVDDGSDDNSFRVLKGLNEKDKSIKVIRFSRNFGQHIAITAGFDQCKGEAIILMDADLQDQPEEIPKLIERFNEGYDVVYAIRKYRQDTFLKKATSKIFLRILSKLVGRDIPSDVGAYRIMRKNVVENLKTLRENSRFITGLVPWLGFSHSTVEVRCGTRFAGKTKYNLWKLIWLSINAITSFSYFPLQIATYLGLLIATFSFILGIHMVIRKLFLGIPVLGYSSIIVSILFLGGIQLVILGIIGEYIGRIYTETQGRPLYIVKEMIE